jgi:hypothetical protein
MPIRLFLIQPTQAAHSLDANGEDPAADYEGQVSALGPAGSVVIYNACAWRMPNS